METHLQAALNATRVRLRLVTGGIALAVWLAGTAGLLLLFVVWDHWQSGGVPVAAGSGIRWIYLLASLGWLSAALIAPFLRQINDLYIARLIERAHPEFRNDLVGALQIAPREDLPGSGSVAAR